MLQRKMKVMFLCTGNACRNQMAEGWARQLRGDAIEPYAAGLEPLPDALTNKNQGAKP